MIKFVFISMVYFLCFGVLSAAARNQQDTTVSIGQDTAVVSEQDSIAKAEAPEDSFYLPVPDSLFSNTRSIRFVSEKQVTQYKKNPDYAYANDSEYWRKDPPDEPGLIFRMLNSQVLGWIFLALIGGLILYGVYQLALENNFALLIRTRRPKADHSIPGVSDEKIDFDESIRLYQDEGNYRMAIRLMYLRLIQTLQGKSGMTIRDSFTNAEITRAMGNHSEAAAFRWLATAYEYVFYGGFMPELEMYTDLKNRFEALEKIFSV